MDWVCIALGCRVEDTHNYFSAGDSHSSPGMLEFFKMIGEVHPGIFIHSVYIEEKLDKDRQAGFVSLYLPMPVLYC